MTLLNSTESPSVRKSCFGISGRTVGQPADGCSDRKQREGRWSSMPADVHPDPPGVARIGQREPAIRIGPALVLRVSPYDREAPMSELLALLLSAVPLAAQGPPPE